MIKKLSNEVFMEETKSPAPRTNLNVTVEFRRNYARDEAMGSLMNISMTGAFIKHKDGVELRANDKVHCKFNVSGRIREIDALVVWTNRFGAGIKFLHQNNQDSQIVDDLIYFVEEKKTGSRSILEDIFKKVA